MGGSPCCGRVLSMEDWGAVRDRLRADADVLDQQALAADTHEEMLSVRRFAADIRAALERVADLEDQVDYWMGKELALRQRVEEMERGRVAPDDLGVMRDASGLSERCHELVRRLLKQSQRAEAAEAKLARCVEALEEGLLLTASWADVRTHNWRNEVRAALAAAKEE